MLAIIAAIMIPETPSFGAKMMPPITVIALSKVDCNLVSLYIPDAIISILNGVFILSSKPLSANNMAYSIDM